MQTLESSDYWVFSDLDAMKQLLLNHQVWDLKNAGPELPTRLLTFMNGLVSQKAIHKAFNSRRLHLVGIVRWTLHLMLEATELYTTGEMAKRTDTSSRWYCEAPHVQAVAVGGNPDNPLLESCKTLLRRVLTFMLTPGSQTFSGAKFPFSLCWRFHACLVCRAFGRMPRRSNSICCSQAYDLNVSKLSIICR